MIQRYRSYDLWSRLNTQRSCHFSLVAPSLERSVFRGLPSVGSAGLTSTVSSLDLDIPFQSAEVRLGVRAVEAGDDLGEEDVVDWVPLAYGQALDLGLVEAVVGRVHLVPPASHLPYHQACRRAFHLGCYLAYYLACRGESLQAHRVEHFRLEGHQVYFAEPFVRLSLQR